MKPLTVIKETDLSTLASISYVKSLVMSEAHKAKAIDTRHKLNKPMRVYMAIAWKAYRKA